MFDEGGGSSLAANGKVSISASIWLETLLGVDTKDRDGRHKETLYSIHEIAGDWLGWNLTNYRMTGKPTGRALAIALHSVNNIWVTMNDRGGGYSPVLLGPVSPRRYGVTAAEWAMRGKGRRWSGHDFG